MIKRITLTLFVLASCRYVSTQLGVEACSNSDGAFLSCSEDETAKLICQSGLQILIDCGGDCLDDASGQGCAADLFCGDGLLNGSEACDEGAANSDTNPDACRTDCSLARCGDGVLDAGEGCDDGNQSNNDACTNDCIEGVCGDGFVQSGEACDDGGTVSNDGCSATCQSEVCGDGIANQSELCDGADLNGESCASRGFTAGDLTCFGNCTLDDSGCSTCGDGVVEGPEACDDTATTTGCDNSCAFDVGTCAAAISMTPPLPPNQGPPPNVRSDTSVAGASALNGGGACLDSNNNLLPPQSGREQVFSFNPPPNATFNFTLNLTADDASRDMSLYLMVGSCSGGAVTQCSDTPGGVEVLSSSITSAAAPTPMFFVVDSKNASGEGPFSLTITPN